MVLHRGAKVLLFSGPPPVCSWLLLFSECSHGKMFSMGALVEASPQAVLFVSFKTQGETHIDQPPSQNLIDSHCPPLLSTCPVRERAAALMYST